MSANTRIHEERDDQSTPHHSPDTSTPIDTPRWAACNASEQTLVNPPAPQQHFCSCGNPRCAAWIRRAAAAHRQRPIVVDLPTDSSRSARELSRQQPQPALKRKRSKRFMHRVVRKFGSAEPLAPGDVGHSTVRRGTRRRRSIEDRAVENEVQQEQR